MLNTPTDIPRLDPQSAAELLPWLINDSLGHEEAEAVLSHVEAGALSADLAATGEMFWLTEQHVPSLTLAEFALGLPLVGLSREEVKAHVDVCASCREELALIQADDVTEEDAEEMTTAPVLDFANAQRRKFEEKNVSTPRRPAWRRYVAAAAVATAVAGTLLFQAQSEFDESPLPTAVVASAPTSAGDAATEENLRSLTPENALFSDGFESGDTGSWTIVSN